MKPNIFDKIGLSADQIRALTRGTSGPAIRTKDPADRPRPHCLVCGQRINKYNCKPIRQPS
jgi:hypothetical protein